jgi:hypothetical protein
VFYELLQENEYSGISESEYTRWFKYDRDWLYCSVKIWLGSEQSVSSNEAENVSNISSMQPDVWANSGAEWPHFSFTGEPGINVDLEDTSIPLEYFELFCTPDIVEVIAKETNHCAQQFLENMPNIKLKSVTHRWTCIENYIIIKYSEYLLLELQQCFWWYKRFSDDFIVCKR